MLGLTVDVTRLNRVIRRSSRSWGIRQNKEEGKREREKDDKCIT